MSQKLRFPACRKFPLSNFRQSFLSPHLAKALQYNKIYYLDSSSAIFLWNNLQQVNHFTYVECVKDGRIGSVILALNVILKSTIHNHGLMAVKDHKSSDKDDQIAQPVIVSNDTHFISNFVSKLQIDIECQPIKLWKKFAYRPTLFIATPDKDDYGGMEFMMEMKRLGKAIHLYIPNFDKLCVFSPLHAKDTLPIMFKRAKKVVASGADKWSSLIQDMPKLADFPCTEIRHNWPFFLPKAEMISAIPCPTTQNQKLQTLKSFIETYLFEMETVLVVCNNKKEVMEVNEALLFKPSNTTFSCESSFIENPSNIASFPIHSTQSLDQTIKSFIIKRSHQRKAIIIEKGLPIDTQNINFSIILFYNPPQKITEFVKYSQLIGSGPEKTGRIYILFDPRCDFQALSMLQSEMGRRYGVWVLKPPLHKVCSFLTGTPGYQTFYLRIYNSPASFVFQLLSHHGIQEPVQIAGKERYLIDIPADTDIASLDESLEGFVHLEPFRSISKPLSFLQAPQIYVTRSGVYDPIEFADFPNFCLFYDRCDARGYRWDDKSYLKLQTLS